MFRTALAFLVLAIMAAVFGSGRIIPPATGIATLLFYLFLAVLWLRYYWDSSLAERPRR